MENKRLQNCDCLTLLPPFFHYTPIKMYLVHPNNCLTEIDDFEVPNLETHIKSLQLQIQEIDRHVDDQASLKAHEPGFYEKVNILKEFKNSEINYLQSYLNVLNLVNSIEEKCESSDASNGSHGTAANENYDYDKEDEILSKIEIEMTNFHKYEKELAANKQHWEIFNLETVSNEQGNDRTLLRNHRNNSMTKFEQELIEDIHHTDINI